MAEILGTFEQIVLLAVLGLKDDAYGRSILRSVQEAVPDDRRVAAGAIYATLDRLENKGYLTSRVETGTVARGGRPKRYYTITANGAAALNATRTLLDGMWRGQRKPIEVML